VLALLAPAVIAVLVAFLAPLAPARGLGVLRIEQGCQATGHWQRAQERQQATTGITCGQPSREGVEMSVVHTARITSLLRNQV
jgi:hypothetical protein